MPLFHALRFTLAVTELYLLATILRLKLGYLWWFTVLLWISATAHLIPAAPLSPEWQAYIQTPVLAVLLALSVATSFDLFRFLRVCMFPGERRLMLALSVTVGLVPIVAGWIWNPEDWYQSAMLARQYLLIGITCATITAWWWCVHSRPVGNLPPLIKAHGRLWMLWLLAGIPDAISAKGGLLWSACRWKGGMHMWLMANDGTVAMRVVLMVSWVICLRWCVRARS